MKSQPTSRSPLANIALVFFLTFSICWANPPEKSVCDTTHRAISDNVTIQALESSQKFYDSAFKDIQGSYSTFLTRIVITVTVIGVIATILGMIATAYFRNAKKYNEKVHDQLKEQQKSLNELKEAAKKESEIAKKTVLELEKELKKQFDIENIQDKSDTSFRFLSRIYRKLAEDYLKKDNFQEYFYYMHIFYRCLVNINVLNKYDLSRLNRTFELLKEKPKKMAKLENKHNICWYIVHLLKFINRCSNDNKLNEYFTAAKSIYNNLFTLTFNNFASHNDIIEELKNCMKNDEYEDSEIIVIIELTKRYRDDPSIAPAL